ncbi:MAG: hypothetical protein KGN77_05385 [Xanthomonadaceae bacterium]|nr:hypothetical protein [Xanthomonadaceae bacterium]MDE1963343.1 hypothetical protein [Xanthomonadaceae bacterium]
MHAIISGSLLAIAALTPVIASRQSSLPGVTVTAPYTRSHGGYVISGDFRVDARMPTVVFPAQALVKDDILNVQPVHLADDEYLVLQECASADCRLAHVVRVWNADGAVGWVPQSPWRVWIRHENKYFIWMQRMPVIQSDCLGCASHFVAFQSFSPPMTLHPTGAEVANNRALLRERPPRVVPVVRQVHEGATFVVRFEGGATVRIQRMHAAD